MPSLPTTNLTGRWNASTAADLFTTNNFGGAPSGAVTSGTQNAQVWRSAVTSTDLFRVQAVIASWVNDAALNLPSVRFGVNQPIAAGGDYATVNSSNADILASQFMTASGWTVLVSFLLDSSSVPNNSDPWANMTMFGEFLRNLGLSIKKPSGYQVVGFNDDGVAMREINQPIFLNTPHVACLRLASGTLALSIDGGTESTIASGNTNSLAWKLCLGRRFISTETQFSGRIGELAIYNVGLSGSTLSDAIGYFTGKWLASAAGAGFNALNIAP